MDVGISSKFTHKNNACGFGGWHNCDHLEYGYFEYGNSVNFSDVARAPKQITSIEQELPYKLFCQDPK